MIRFPADEGGDPRTEPDGSTLLALASTDHAEGILVQRSGHLDSIAETARNPTLERARQQLHPEPMKTTKYVSGD